MPYDATTKRPSAVLDYLFRWGPFLEGDTIATSSFPGFPAGITNQNTSNTTTDVRLWVAGGTSGQDYPVLNRITTAGGRTMEWNLVVRVADFALVPNLLAPPYTTIEDHIEYTPQADGESAMKVERVSEDAANIVQTIAPRVTAPQSVLTQAMDTSQDTLTITDPFPYTLPGQRPSQFPDAGDILVELELISYSRRSDYSTLADARRGMHATTPATHAAGAVVREVGYPLRARNAELAVFEWLFLSRGWRPGRSGVLGSESYQVGTAVHDIVRQIMGPYYGRRGGGVRKAVPMTSFARRRGSSFDWQRGWYDVR